MIKKVVTVKELLEWFGGYIAKDENGSIYIYHLQPTLDLENKAWNFNLKDKSFERLSNLFEVPELEDVDWKDSLRCPKGRREIPTEETPIGTKVWVRNNRHEDWRKSLFSEIDLLNMEFVVFNDSWKKFSFSFCEIATEEDIKNGFRED